MKNAVATMLLKILFYPSPKVMISKDEEKQFNDLYEEALKRRDKLIEYNLPVPKYKFLYYISQNKPIVFHGSNNKLIDSFEPREQTLFNGKIATAVFATKDSIWSIFYAILEKGKISGNIRNGSLSTNNQKTFHFYSLTKSTALNNPWTSGMVYFLPEDSFLYLGKGTIHFNEWICKKTVLYIAKLEVEPIDFYFLNKVATHHPEESIFKSWLMYKFRTLFK
ncbi:hypothetical protein V7112_13430 [Bacillus sp. JJ1566]|uniref:hypothetical protein n=1 Tax=Bacillus sp. JJ1566 TaxID=3122961 RepID=UPI002FFD8F81